MLSTSHHLFPEDLQIPQLKLLLAHSKLRKIEACNFLSHSEWRAEGKESKKKCWKGGRHTQGTVVARSVSCKVAQQFAIHVCHFPRDYYFASRIYIHWETDSNRHWCLVCINALTNETEVSSNYMHQIFKYMSIIRIIKCLLEKSLLVSAY